MSLIAYMKQRRRAILLLHLWHGFAYTEVEGVDFSELSWGLDSLPDGCSPTQAELRAICQVLGASVEHPTTNPHFWFVGALEWHDGRWNRIPDAFLDLVK